MARDPAARPASMAAVKVEIDQLRSMVRADADFAAPTETRVWPKVQRLPRRAVMTGVALLTAVALAGWGISWSRSAVPVAGQLPYVAVMPLTNLSGQASNDHLGVGIADALTTGLTKLSTISVIPRESTAAAARSASEPATLAAELGVDFLVLGSLQRSGDNIRVDARVINRAGAVAWAGSAEALVSNLFDIEQRLAEQVVEALRVWVSPAERRQLAAPPTRSAAALEEYWRGILFLEKTDPASVDETIRVFERAIALDDRFSLAHAGLGAAFVRKFTITNDRAWMTKALDSASRALAFDPGQIPVRLLVANVHASTGRNATAVEELRAILIDQPTNDEARRHLAAIFESEGRQAEALEQLQAALAIRPEYWRNHDDLGLFYYRIRQIDSAVRAFTRVTELRPDSARGYQRLGAAYLDLGDKAAARAAFDRAISITPDASAYSNIGTIHYSEGEYEAAATAFKAAIQLRPTGAAYHRNLGDAYEKLGRTLDARQEYEEAARITERAVNVNPSDGRTAAQLAVYSAKLRRFADAERHIVRALTLNPASPDVLYRRAVVSALAGDTANAIKALSDAVSKGYAREQVRDDDDLASLRGLPEFQSLIALLR